MALEAERMHLVSRARGRAASTFSGKRPLQPRIVTLRTRARAGGSRARAQSRVPAESDPERTGAPALPWAAARNPRPGGAVLPGPAAAAPRRLLFGKKKARLPVRPKCAFQLLCISSVLNSFKESTKRNGLQCFKKS